MPATKYTATRDLRAALTAAGTDCARIYTSRRKNGTVRAKAFCIRGDLRAIDVVRKNLPAGYAVTVGKKPWHKGFNLIIIGKS